MCTIVQCSEFGHTGEVVFWYLFGYNTLLADSSVYSVLKKLLTALKTARFLSVSVVWVEMFGFESRLVVILAAQLFRCDIWPSSAALDLLHTEDALPLLPSK